MQRSPVACPGSSWETRARQGSSSAGGGLSLLGDGGERVERGAGSGFEGVLPSRGQRGLVHGGRKWRDAILNVAVARPDLPWLVTLAATVPQLLGGPQQFGRRLGLARLTDDHRRRLQGVTAAPEVAVTAEDLDSL